MDCVITDYIHLSDGAVTAVKGANWALGIAGVSVCRLLGRGVCFAGGLLLPASRATPS